MAIKYKIYDRSVYEHERFVYDFTIENDEFTMSKRLYNDFDYELKTSNQNFKDYESLSFMVDVLRDESPELMVEMRQDSLDLKHYIFTGK